MVTTMNPHPQILRNALPASRTELAGIAGIDREDLNSGLDSLVVEQFAEHPQANVMDGAGEAIVLKHESERQIFENNNAVGLHQLMCDFVPPIPALVGDALMQARHPVYRLEPVLTTPLFACQATLQHAQLF
jgi:hypothetical protein